MDINTTASLYGHLFPEQHTAIVDGLESAFSGAAAAEADTRRIR